MVAISDIMKSLDECVHVSPMPVVPFSGIMKDIVDVQYLKLFPHLLFQGCTSIRSAWTAQLHEMKSQHEVDINDMACQYKNLSLVLEAKNDKLAAAKEQVSGC